MIHYMSCVTLCRGSYTCGQRKVHAAASAHVIIWAADKALLLYWTKASRHVQSLVDTHSLLSLMPESRQAKCGRIYLQQLANSMLLTLCDTIREKQ